MHSVNGYLLPMPTMWGTRSRKKDRRPQRTRCPGQEIAKRWDNDSPEWEKHRLLEARGWSSHLVWVRIREGEEGSEGSSDGGDLEALRGSQPDKRVVGFSQSPGGLESKTAGRGGAQGRSGPQVTGVPYSWTLCTARGRESPDIKFGRAG